MLQEAQVRGLVAERNVETETVTMGRGPTISVQQHLIMPSDRGVPDITIKLWERVNAPRTADPPAE